MQPSVDEAQLKAIFKDALREVMAEQREFIRDVVEEALEDIALAHAIQENAASPAVSREEVFQLLGDAA